MKSDQGYQNPKVNALIYDYPLDHAGRIHEGDPRDFTVEDWLDLARAALDQAGLTEKEQTKIQIFIGQIVGQRERS